MDKEKTPLQIAEEKIARAKRARAASLDLSKIELSTLPESLAELTQLDALNLEDNQLSTLPESLGQLTQLERLVVFSNKLSTLPESLGQLTQLQLLALSSNRLRTLPESLGQLTQLQSLELDNNQLSTLPESLGQLTQLKTLFLFDNQLKTLPASLRKLTKLTYLSLRDNVQLGIPAEVLENGNPRKILDYYFRVRAAAVKRPLNEAKLILVGRGGAGKTLLVNRLLHERFDSNEKMTDGIRISEWDLRLFDREDVRLHVWDFGGQEIMHHTHQFFLTKRSVYLVVLTGREGAEDEDAEYWLKFIESFGAESPVIVVLNKSIGHPFDVNRRALQQKYPMIRGFIATDCEPQMNLDKLRATIESEVNALEHLRDPFPDSWFQIKERLARKEKNYLTFDQFRRVCAKHGEKDKEEQEALAGYLHALGIALNFKDDPRLQDKHVLNPHWVTNGIYKILTAATLAEQQGELRLGDLKKILKQRQYPGEMHGFLFDLMKKFDLCFSFPGDDGHFLIPQLLDKQEPEATAEFRPAECLNFQYHYPVLPEGLLPRFIVRTHSLSEHSQRWRSGVVLQFEGNRALVKADVGDKKVFISVTGPVASRRRLLAVIRSDLERIHHDMWKRTVPAMVPVPARPQTVVPYDDLRVMEAKGRRTHSVVVDDDVLDLNVRELLDGIDLEGTRQAATPMDREGRAARLFYSYSHKDESLRNELETHLKLLQRQGVIQAWHDRKIMAGDDWKQKIDENLEAADIILLLVSADFIASEYCYEKEMKRAMERHTAGEARVVPVIIRDVNWQKAPFAKLQALPKEALAVMKWPDRDSAWRNVAEGIERVAEEIRKRREGT